MNIIFNRTMCFLLEGVGGGLEDFDKFLAAVDILALSIRNNTGSKSGP